MQEIYDLKIFSGIDKTELENLISKLPREKFLSWEIIMNQWDVSDGKWYIIISGWVDVFINSEKITSLEAWDVFWEIALLNEDERTATIIASSDLETLVLSQEAILEIMNSDNYLNKEIMRRVQENIENNR